MAHAARSSKLDLSRLEPYPAVKHAVRELTLGIASTLPDQILSVAFDGSVALGGFDPLRSDVDLFVVTRGRISKAAVGALAALHSRFARSDPAWGDEIEVIYVSADDLEKRSTSDRPFHLYVERRTRGALRTGRFGLGWLVHLSIVRRPGTTVMGESLQNLVMPVQDAALREIAALSAQSRIELYRDNPALLESPGSRAFAVLTGCRILHTFQSAKVVPKMEAAVEILDITEGAVHEVVLEAMQWRKTDVFFGPTPEDVLRLLEFVRAQVNT